MKKISILFAALAAFTFSSCSKTEVYEASDGAKDFAISALITKTVNDGASTEWNAGDAINVFHASAGTTTYGTNDQFTIAEEDLGTGTFRGTLTEDQYESNDWYAFYPYNSKLTTPANTGAGYFNIGCKNSNSAAQVQNGNNSTAHLCGEYFPMWAQAKAVAKGSGVSLTFNNAVSVVKFHVTNKTSKPITVTSLSITAEQDIIGSYYIDFSGDAPAFKSSGATYVAKEAKLSVSNGTALDVNASADFYLAIKPFSNPATGKLIFKVNGYEKAVTAAAEFKAGAIKTVNFDFDKEEKDYTGTYVALIENSGNNYFAMSSTDDGATTKRFKSIDATYDGSAKFTTSKSELIWNVAKTDGGYTFENGGKYISWTSGNSAILADEAKVLTITPNGEKYVKISFQSSASETRTLSKNNSGAFFAFYANEGQKVNFILVPAEFDNVPEISPIEDPEKIPAAGATGVEVSYSINNPVSGKSVSAVSAENWVKNFSYATEGKITFDVEENSVATERSSVVTVSYPGAESVTFTVTQAAAGAKEPIELDLTTKAAGTAAYNTTTTYGDWKIVYGANNNKGWAYFKMGGKNTTISSYNPCYIYYTKKVSDKIDEITVHIPSGSLKDSKMSVKSWGVYIYSDEALKTQVDYVAGGTITNKEGSFSFKPTEGKTWQNCWVKVSWDLANTSSTNGIVCVDNVTIKL